MLHRSISHSEFIHQVVCSVVDDTQAHDQSQVGMSATQQSVAMSSQRTAQYHWGPPLQAPTQQDQTCAPLCSAASQAQLPGNQQEAGSSTARCDSRAGQKGSGQQAVPTSMIQPQPQPHRKAAYADQDKQHLPPTTYGVSVVDVCALSSVYPIEGLLLVLILALPHADRVVSACYMCCAVMRWGMP